MHGVCKPNPCEQAPHRAFSLSPELCAKLTAITGPAYALTDMDDMAPFLAEKRGLYHNPAAMVLRPGSTAEVAAIMEIANATNASIVPQGGNTGLVGAQVPLGTGNEIVLSLGRLDRIRAIDPLNNTMTVEAGCILADIQKAADEADRLFPLNLAARGSCQIGGNLSTNAGGANVLAYGNARGLVLGIEVVLADGRIWNGLRTLRKDNTGYDLKQLFLGAEGTLGIITAAVLQLFSRPRDHATAFVAVGDPQAALDLLALADGADGGRVVALELLPRLGVELTIRHAGARDPLPTPYGWYVLLELTGGQGDGTLNAVMEDILARAHERGLVRDAMICASGDQRDRLWHMRDSMSRVQNDRGASIKHDISVPVSHIPDFLGEADAQIGALAPGAGIIAFGHIGDGNIHYDISQPEGADGGAFLRRTAEINEVVYGIVRKHGGSISAEHGIGRMKRQLMCDIKDPVEFEMMWNLKKLFDPKGILNPGKMLPDR
ncbi:MAG: FAD-binding oxidoreductase [Hyphomicrobiales bacterium]